jgi:hypothetical protein
MVKTTTTAVGKIFKKVACAVLALVKYRILFYKRLIDDAIVIILKLADYKLFMQGMNDFGPEGRRLEWESTTPSRQVDFLDLTITIQPDGVQSPQKITKNR